MAHMARIIGVLPDFQRFSTRPVIANIPQSFSGANAAWRRALHRRRRRFTSERRFTEETATPNGAPKNQSWGGPDVSTPPYPDRDHRRPGPFRRRLPERGGPGWRS